MRKAYHLAVVLVALVVVFAASLAAANPVMEPRPMPITSEHELRDSMGRGKYSERHDGRVALSTLWDGRIPLLRGALASEHHDVKREAMRALGDIGNAEAVELLRGVLSDNTAQLEDIMVAANSLASARDTSSISLMESVAKRFAARREELGQTREGVTMGAHLDILGRAIQRLRRPDLRRPLIIRDAHFVRYRFLLDDISRVFLSRYPPDKPTHTFGSDEYRTICDLLQEGGFVEPGMVSETEYLVFELADGRSIRLIRDGVNFCRFGGSWERGDPGFCMASEGLAQFIDSKLGRPLPAD